MTQETQIQHAQAAQQQQRVPEIIRAWQEIDRVFDQLTAGFGLPFARRFASLGGNTRRTNESAASLPFTDIAETDKDYRVSMELPGVDPKNIQIDVEGSALLIRADRRRDDETQQGNVIISEREYGTVQRALTLSNDIDRDQIRAEYRNGVLAVSLPKSQQAQAQRKRIDVQTAN